VSNRKTSIQPSILVDAAGVPIPGGGGAIGSPSVSAFSQALAVGALDFTDVVALIKTPRFVSLHFSAPLPGPQTLTITYDSADGVAFDTVRKTEVLPAGTTDKFFVFEPNEGPIRAADHYRIQLTNTGLPVVTVSGNFNYTV
jgi:hypothetical protein